MEIRSFEPADRDEVIELARRLTIGVAPWRDPAAVESAVRGWLEGSTGTDGALVAWVCVTGDRVVGFVSVSSTQHFGGEQDAYVGELVVHEDVEGHGVGRSLMAEAERWAQECGYRCITLHTGATNTPARAFYARLGYMEEDIKLTKLLGG
jgi:ribosomal protein S18 acetylase RimI-like enzyme